LLSQSWHDQSRLSRIIESKAFEDVQPWLVLQIMVGVQHFSHILLSMLLVDKLKASSPSRIIYTSSASEATAQKEIPWDNLG